MNNEKYLILIIKKIRKKKMRYSFIKELLNNNSGEINNRLKDICDNNDIDINDFLKYLQPSTDKKKNQICDNFTENSVPGKMIKGIYKKLAVIFHPDKSGEDSEFIEILKAYEDNDYLTLFEYIWKYSDEYKYNDNNNNNDKNNDIFLLLERQLDYYKTITKNLEMSIHYQLLVKNNDSLVLEYIKLFKLNINLKKENEELKKDIMIRNEILSKYNNK